MTFGSASNAISVVAVNDAFDPFLHRRSAKVQQEADPKLGKAQIGEKLLRVNGSEMIERLHLDDHALLDEEIEPESLLEGETFVRETNRILSLDT